MNIYRKRERSTRSQRSRTNAVYVKKGNKVFHAMIIAIKHNKIHKKLENIPIERNDLCTQEMLNTAAKSLIIGTRNPKEQTNDL